MKINQYNNEQFNKTNRTPSFKGAAFTNGIAGMFNFLSINPAIGAVCVDVTAMGTPRTTIDSFRGPDALKETAFREYGGTVNFATMGLWGVGSSWLLGKLVDKAHGIDNCGSIFADNSSIEVFLNLYKKNKGKTLDKTIKNYVKDFCGTLETLNGSDWKKITNQTEITKIADCLYKAIKATDKKKTAEFKDFAVKRIISQTGGAQDAKFGKLQLVLFDMVDHLISLGKAYSKLDGNKGEISSDFIKALKRNKTLATFGGLLVPFLVAAFTQPINRYLTKLRTGKDGFVGIQGETADDSSNFLLKKILLASTLFVSIIATIGKDLFRKIQCTSKVPNISQIKLMFGVTIVSRIFAARDGNEMRESTIKDTLGFANWLLLGNLVTRLVAYKLDPSSINYDRSTLPPKASKFRKAIHWIKNSKFKTPEEILYSEIQDIAKNEKVLSFKELFKSLPDDSPVKKRIASTNKAQLAGYLYSMIALGVAVPLFNMFYTKHKVKKNQNTNEADKKVKIENKEQKKELSKNGSWLMLDKQEMKL